MRPSTMVQGLNEWSYEARFATGYTVPHYQCYKAAKTFRHKLHQLAHRSSAGMASPQLIDFFHQGLEFVCLAETVQIYAAMTVEAALNLCGIIELGEPAYYANRASQKRHERLALIISYAMLADEERDKQLRVLTERLASYRNRLVHPKPAELPVSAAISQFPRDLERAADEALSDAAEVLRLLGQVNPAWRPMLSIA